MRSSLAEWLVESGQRADERDDIVFGLPATQVVPWLLALPMLLAAMARYRPSN